MARKKHIRFDWAIKRLLRQKANFDILEGFLSELLKEDIKIVEILESESNQETETDKYNRVDILVKDARGQLIIIEVQNRYAIDYFMRILYGVSKVIAEHIDLGDAYHQVRRVISINVVYFELGQGNDYIYRGTTQFKGFHNKEPLQLTLAQKRFFAKERVEELYPEIFIIKVNAFDDLAKDTLDEWIYFLKNSEIKQEFSAKGLQKANEVLKVANMSDEERRDYQRFQEVLSDRASIAVTMEFEAKLMAEKLSKKAIEEAEKLSKEAIEEAEKLSKEAIEEAEKLSKEAIEEAEKERDEAQEKADEAERKANEAERKANEAERKANEAEKRAQAQKAKETQTIQKLISLGTLEDEAIAEIAQVSLDRVREVSAQMGET